MKRISKRQAAGRTTMAGASLALLALALLAVPAIAGDPGPAPKPAPAVEVAANIPVPHSKPTVIAHDPIGAVIRAEADDPGPSEDSDVPEAATAPASSDPPKSSPIIPQTKIGATGLRLALKFLDDGDAAAATLAAYALPDKVDIKIVDWLVATSGLPSVPSSRIADVAARLSDWPGQSLLRLRYEQALAREKPPAAVVAKDLGGQAPISSDGTLLLAQAYLDLGRKNDAAALIRPYWRTGKFGDDVEATIRKDFGNLLTSADHKARMDRLLYDEDAQPALREAAVLDKGEKALATAVVAVMKKAKTDKALAAVPAAVQKDPLFIYARVKTLRRADHLPEAAALLLSAPRDPKLLVDPDAWWVERRLISRGLLDKGDAKTAYRLAASHSGESSTYQAEAEFHAGWYALEFLHDPATATKHFQAIEQSSTLPLSQSRAEYWLGRAAAAAGNAAEATDRFKRAAAYPTTFYGQLALAWLGAKRLPLKAPPVADAGVKARFAARDLVQVINRLTAANHDDRVDIFYRSLAEQLDDPAEISLLCELADSNGEHQIALQIGKLAASRGLPVETLAFPIAAIPASTDISAVERPVVFAVARQESAFNQAAVSSAGARGLLQLMPATAKHTAGVVGLPYSLARLTSDPGYNATLGSAHLSELFDDFGGSYIMAFASYNAGKSRIYDWIKAHGDPRDPKVDVVDWIELIPFTETRNYVQRLMENLEVYRARLGAPELTIEADLKRGKLPKTE